MFAVFATTAQTRIARAPRQLGDDNCADAAALRGTPSSRIGLKPRARVKTRRQTNRRNVN
jgi:hypothetical protein